MKSQRGITLITVMAMVVIFLAIAVTIASLATGNSQTVGNVYTKQQYYDVAESGIDRGMRDMDSTLPSPGASGFLTATPPPPSPPAPIPSQTPLSNVPGIGYMYSYWYNAAAVATPTADPWAGSYNIPSNHTVTVPARGAVIWSKTTVGIRDVAIEAIVERLSSSGGNCALCAGTNITVTGNPGAQGSPPPWCQGPGQPGVDKVCTDYASPSPSSVPIVAGGTYTTTGNCNNFSCSYGDGTGSSTPYPHIQTSASPATLAGFLASASTLNSFANADLWKSIANGSTTIKYLDCSGGCNVAQLNNPLNNPSAGQITYVKGSLNLGTSTPVVYSGVWITQCVTLSGHGVLQGNGFSAETIAWGTNAQCGGNAISTTGNSLWNGGLAYAAAGSAQICGTGVVKYSGFYGAIIAAGGISLCGNGDFMWESGLTGLALNFGPYVENAFAQY